MIHSVSSSSSHSSSSPTVVSEVDIPSQVSPAFSWLISLPNIIEKYPPGENWTFQMDEVADNSEMEPSTSSGHKSTFHNCPLTSQSGQVTSEDNSGCDQQAGQASSSLVDISPNIKVENSIPESGASHSEQVNEGESDEVWTVITEKQRLFIEGVEVLHCTPARAPNLAHLLCSVCDHAIPNPNKVYKVTLSGIDKMKNHIELCHKDHPRKGMSVEETTQIKFKCSFCERRFEMKRFLGNHMRVHATRKKKGGKGQQKTSSEN